jgi:hypothetical protein
MTSIPYTTKAVQLGSVVSWTLQPGETGEFYPLHGTRVCVATNGRIGLLGKVGEVEVKFDEASEGCRDLTASPEAFAVANIDAWAVTVSALVYAR